MRRLLLFAVLGFSWPAIAQAPDPAKGFVPDASTAIRIAEAVWLPIYGKGIYDKRPFVATLKGDVWLVTGSLPKEALGGVPEARIAKRDGRVLEIKHGQ